MANRASTQNLRKRVRYHYRGNAAGSTLRLTLGCLLGLELRRVGSGKRMTSGKAGETTLSQWMADNARVCWIEQSEPWDLESQLISQLDLPLNLDQNRHNAQPPEGDTGRSTPGSTGVAHQLVGRRKRRWVVVWTVRGHSTAAKGDHQMPEPTASGQQKPSSARSLTIPRARRNKLAPTGPCPRFFRR
ncbi:GIY-YIG nuclease family protein [Streptomyces marokkonensis]|uniref:GIY-YIG nuclease family protein n=1 Tax=Streptomyces marokkonensis TaxID=324855 RepID=UPI001FCA5F0C|nr:hypothetical protein [Streptomyces marokkonensis]